MSRETSSKFVYVSYIRTSPEKLWQSLTTPEFQQQYWFGVRFETEWKQGAPWRMMYPDGRMTDSGEIVEYDPPRRMVLKWRNEFRPELTAEGFSQCVFELEQIGDAVKLRITHTIDVPDSKFIEAVSGGWPQILSNLKSLLETGEICVTR
jgi:uncharacterized protein YndB with AHSA1/START domain